jgi:hypothetical protein
VAVKLTALERETGTGGMGNAHPAFFVRGAGHSNAACPAVGLQQKMVLSPLFNFNELKVCSSQARPMS